ncbi:Uncharacterised protein [Mycobacteroides abscessus subsp. abscessus]|nr:Uncharacterised protein [Mycobacteroides abscessus subsp. abscessus]
MSRTAIIIVVGVVAALAFLAVGAVVKKVGIQSAVTHFLVAWAGVPISTSTSMRTVHPTPSPQTIE